MADADLVRASWAKISGDLDGAGRLFYATLFEMHPEAREAFKNTNMEQQPKRLMKMVDAAVGLLDKPDELVPVLHELGRRHIKYGVVDAHYPLVGGALLATLGKALGPAFDEATAAAWGRIYGVLETQMKAGAAAAPAAQ
jgi:methyl-accepting chemotaxis protein